MLPFLSNQTKSYLKNVFKVIYDYPGFILINIMYNFPSTESKDDDVVLVEVGMGRPDGWMDLDRGGEENEKCREFFEIIHAPHIAHFVCTFLIE